MTFILSLQQGRPAAGIAPASRLIGTDLVVGAAADCDWQLDNVAPRHCQFGFRGGTWLIVDLGSGTTVNGRVLDRPAAIAVGDVIAIGGCVIAVSNEAAPATAPESESIGPLLAAAGLELSDVGGDGSAVLAAAGTLLRHLVVGLVDQLAQRARAKAELGAEATMFSIGANNPLKVLPADRALVALLTPSGTGIMPPEQAVADAFADMETHQAATLGAMQDALAATLERFSPKAIRARAQSGGLMARVMPGAREATFWQAYEKEFDGVVKGSSDAFVELFATEFARSYKNVSSAPRRPS